MKPFSNFLTPLLKLCVVALLYIPILATAEPRVLVTIKPIHSLVAMVTAGVLQPQLLIAGSQSPHLFSLKPSDAEKLQQADVIFRIDEEFETSLTTPVRNLAAQATVVSLAEVDGLVSLPLREHLADFVLLQAMQHGHDEHDEEHGHDEHDEEHGHDEHAHAGHSHSNEFDLHVWLDPVNAQLMLDAIASTLGRVDSAHRATYVANARKAKQRLSSLVARTEAKLKHFDTRFLVFHDAFQYFESRFGLQSTGAILLNPESPPSAKHIRRIEQVIKEKKVQCIFSEPQFSPDFLDEFISRLGVRTSELDPLGSGIAQGKDMYITLISQMSNSFQRCLNG